MYTWLLLLLLLCYFCANSLFFILNNNWHISAAKVRVNTALVIYLLICTAFAAFFLGSEFGGYLSVLSDDSLRYTREAVMFSKSPWVVDELSGEYLNYKVTPKMGISSLLAWLSFPFDTQHPLIFYIINNLFLLVFVFVIVSLLHTIFSLLYIRSIYFYSVIIILFILPMDFYWLFKMLRESAANYLLLILLLLPLLMILKPKRRYVFMYTYFSFWLLLYRPQLVVLSGFFFFVSSFFTAKKVNYLILSAAIIAFSLFQSIATTGIQRLHGVFINLGLSFIGDVLEYLLHTEGSVFVVLILSVAIIASCFVKHSEYHDKALVFKRFRFISICFFLLGVAVFLTQSFMQIRFIYPFLFFAKIALMCHIILKFSDKRNTLL